MEKDLNLTEYLSLLIREKNGSVSIRYGNEIRLYTLKM